MKLLQVVLILFVFAIVAAVPVALGGLAFSSTASTGEVPPAAGGSTVQFVSGLQQISIHASPQGYSPSSFSVKKGVPVKILFSADQYAGCGRQLIMQDFGVRVVAGAGETVPIEFTPTKEGVFPYRCSMNMFRGQMTVVA